MSCKPSGTFLSGAGMPQLQAWSFRRGPSAAPSWFTNDVSWQIHLARFGDCRRGGPDRPVMRLLPVSDGIGRAGWSSPARSPYSATTPRGGVRLADVRRTPGRPGPGRRSFCVAGCPSVPRSGFQGVTIIAWPFVRGDNDLRERGQRTPHRILPDSENALPFEKAFAGERGTVIHRGHGGQILLSAFETTGRPDLVLVANLDLAEIRRPFLWRRQQSWASRFR